MTVAQSQAAVALVWLAFCCWALYFTHSQTFGRARPADPGEAIAWWIVLVLLTLSLLSVAAWFVVALLNATVWISPEGQRPAPAFAPGPLDFLAYATIVAFIVVPSLRRLLRWRRRRSGRV